jgi:DNA invertase Pin-like site-specific DNA recombinase
MRVAIYARVSTKDKGQDTENQLHQLRAFAEQHGTIYKVYTDEESGGKADRAEFKQLLLEAYQQQFDLVVFWRLDRFSREGALATLKYLKELKDQGVNYKSFTEPYLDSLGPFGDVIVSMLATIAAQDLIKISENTKAALAKKRAAGVKLDTPGKTRRRSSRFAGSRAAGYQTTPSVSAWAFQLVQWPNTLHQCSLVAQTPSDYSWIR